MNGYLLVNQFDSELNAKAVLAEDFKSTVVIEPGEFLVLDGPGITEMGCNRQEKMLSHVTAGGSLTHRVRADSWWIRRGCGKGVVWQARG